MYDKIYSTDKIENLKIFDDIEQKKNFSNYSIELNRLFGEKSYVNFYKNLIERKRPRCSNFISMFQKPKKLAANRIYDEPFNIEYFEEKLNDMKLKSDQLSYKVKNPYKCRPKMKSITKTKTEQLLQDLKFRKHDKNNTNSKIRLKKDKIYLPDVPDVGRYNPSYDILRKHTYQACFSTSNFHEYNKINTQFNDRNLFKVINDRDPVFGNDKRIKQITLSTSNINNASKTINNESLNKTNRMNKSINNNKSKYATASPYFGNRKRKIKLKNKKIDELNNSSNMKDSQILVRTNGDFEGRCQKRINKLYSTGSNFSSDDSKYNTYNNRPMNTSGINNLKNNHCLQFKNYSKRKPITYKLNYTTEHFTNSDAFNMNLPTRNNNVCIEFNKLSTAKSLQKCVFELEADKNINPPIGAYEPKFDSTSFKVIGNIFLDKKKNPFNKKKRLKRIMFNYDVPSKFLMFQSLNEKK
jgi:hypothetical protein